MPLYEYEGATSFESSLPDDSPSRRHSDTSSDKPSAPLPDRSISSATIKQSLSDLNFRIVGSATNHSEIVSKTEGLQLPYQDHPETTSAGPSRYGTNFHDLTKSYDDISNYSPTQSGCGHCLRESTGLEFNEDLLHNHKHHEKLIEDKVEENRDYMPDSLDRNVDPEIHNLSTNRGAADILAAMLEKILMDGPNQPGLAGIRLVITESVKPLKCCFLFFVISFIWRIPDFLFHRLNHWED